MTHPLQQQLAEMLDDFEKRKAEADAHRQRMESLSATATAPRRVVSVTVGARGELTDLTFPTAAYKRMPPAELAAAILGTAAEARSQLMAKTAELLTPMLPTGMSAADLLSGKAGLNELLGHARTQAAAEGSDH